MKNSVNAVLRVVNSTHTIDIITNLFSELQIDPNSISSSVRDSRRSRQDNAQIGQKQEYQSQSVNPSVFKPTIKSDKATDSLTNSLK